ncbi:hypothetical protein [Bilophila wadsworthia]|uniref:hypothetical protein n=1 Tax=Bilophila wadsworthia TaxID=35833 RepID=UPI003D15D463
MKTIFETTPTTNGGKYVTNHKRRRAFANLASAGAYTHKQKRMVARLQKRQVPKADKNRPQNNGLESLGHCQNAQGTDGGTTKSGGEKGRKAEMKIAPVFARHARNCAGSTAALSRQPAMRAGFARP